MKARILLAGLLLAGAAVLLVAAPRPTPLLLSEVVAKPGPDGETLAFLTIRNAGPPDRLIGASSPAGPVTLYSPVAEDGPPVPNGKASLALDAAHLRIRSEQSLADGSLVPLTLTFENAGEIRAKARLSDPAKTGKAGDMGLFGLGDICIVGDGEPAPAVSLNVSPDGEGWQIDIDAKDFIFSEDLMGLYHVPGMGHAHIYVGGMKLGRLFAPTATIGALPSGTHEVRVTLNTNDHRAYVVDDVPVVATALITVD